jgi:hypothetical protein
MILYADYQVSFDYKFAYNFCIFRFDSTVINTNNVGSVATTAMLAGAANAVYKNIYKTSIEQQQQCHSCSCAVHKSTRQLAPIGVQSGARV